MRIRIVIWALGLGSDVWVLWCRLYMLELGIRDCGRALLWNYDPKLY